MNKSLEAGRRLAETTTKVITKAGLFVRRVNLNFDKIEESAKKDARDAGVYIGNTGEMDAIQHN